VAPVNTRGHNASSMKGESHRVRPVPLLTQVFAGCAGFPDGFGEPFEARGPELNTWTPGHCIAVADERGTSGAFSH
jgi:hypothetical protein